MDTVTNMVTKEHAGQAHGEAYCRVVLRQLREAVVGLSHTGIKTPAEAGVVFLSGMLSMAKAP